MNLNETTHFQTNSTYDGFAEGEHDQAETDSDTLQWLTANNLSHLIERFQMRGLTKHDLMSLDSNDVQTVLIDYGFGIADALKVRSKLALLKRTMNDDQGSYTSAVREEPPLPYQSQSNDSVPGSINEYVFSEEVTRKYQELQAKQVAIEQEMKEMQNERNEKKTQLNKAFEPIIGKLMRRQKYLFNQINEIVDAHEIRSNESIEKIKQDLSRLDQIRNECSDDQKQNDIQEMYQKLQEIDNAPINEDDQKKQSRIKLEITNNCGILARIDVFGKITEYNSQEKFESSTGPKNVFVKNLHSSIDKNELGQMFSRFGTITSHTVQMFPNGKSKEFGFVAFSTNESANIAIHEMTNTEYKGKLLYAGWAQTKDVRKRMFQSLQTQRQIPPRFTENTNVYNRPSRYTQNTCASGYGNFQTHNRPQVHYRNDQSDQFRQWH